MADSENKGYTVQDRRFLHQSEEEKARVREEEQSRKTAPESQPPPEEVALPEITFASFLISLSSAAFIHL